MDIQLVCSANGLAFYVCNYIAKAEPDDLRGDNCMLLAHRP